MKSGKITIYPLESEIEESAEWIFDLSVKLNKLVEAKFTINFYRDDELLISKDFTASDCKEWTKYTLPLGDVILDEDEIEMELISESMSSSQGAILIDNLVLRKGVAAESGVMEITDNAEGPEICFDMFGRRVDRLGKGVYIVKRGAEVVTALSFKK